MTNTNAADAVVTVRGVAEAVIRYTVSSANLPVESLLILARELLQERPEAAGSWELAALEGEASKRTIIDRSGYALTTEEVAQRLDVSPQTVRNMVERLDLISYPVIQGRGWQFPVWQFSARGVHSWVQPLLHAYSHNGWGLVDFLTVPRTTLGGDTYLSLLKASNVDAVLVAARRANPD